MILESRTAVVYGAGGPVGGALAKGLAAEGARCFLVGPRPGPLDAVAAEIREAGGQAETAVVDVFDGAAVDDHADATARRSGFLDVSVGDAGVSGAVGTDRITAQFLTVRAAAQHMTRQGSGVILLPRIAGAASGAAAVETWRRRWERALGPYGVRIVAFPVAGVPPGELGRVVASLAAGPAPTRVLQPFVERPKWSRVP